MLRSRVAGLLGLAPLVDPSPASACGGPAWPRHGAGTLPGDGPVDVSQLAFDAYAQADDAEPTPRAYRYDTLSALVDATTRAPLLDETTVDRAPGSWAVVALDPAGNRSERVVIGEPGACPAEGSGCAVVAAGDGDGTGCAAGLAVLALLLRRRRRRRGGSRPGRARTFAWALAALLLTSCTTTYDVTAASLCEDRESWVDTLVRVTVTENDLVPLHLQGHAAVAGEGCFQPAMYSAALACPGEPIPVTLASTGAPSTCTTLIDGTPLATGDWDFEASPECLAMAECELAGHTLVGQLGRDGVFVVESTE